MSNIVISAHKTICSTSSRITFMDSMDPSLAKLWCIFRKKPTGWNVACTNKDNQGMEFWFGTTVKPKEEDALSYMQITSDHLTKTV
jgi:hypothetical protein